jgi:AcrR family transcriptional regulator
MSTATIPLTTSTPPRSVGRPREFDRDQALEAAMRVFWRHGYEGASLTALTEAMSISRPSLYAAFGDKAGLFREAVARYGSGPGRYVRRALGQPTAREVAEALLRGAAALATDPAGPGGCLWVQAALVSSAEAATIRDEMAALRAGGSVQIQARLERARRDGDLPAHADPGTLTGFIVSLMNGMAVQACNGLDRAALNRVVDLALTAWPTKSN